MTFTPLRPLAPFVPPPDEQQWLDTAALLAEGFAATAPRP
jgi:hypothetical protein